MRLFCGCLSLSITVDTDKDNALKQSNESTLNKQSRIIVDLFEDLFVTPITVFALASGAVVFCNTAARTLGDFHSLRDVLDRVGASGGDPSGILDAVRQGHCWRGLVKLLPPGREPAGDNDLACSETCDQGPRSSPAVAETADVAGSGAQHTSTGPPPQVLQGTTSVDASLHITKGSGALSNHLMKSSSSRSRRWMRNLFSKASRRANGPAPSSQHPPSASLLSSSAPAVKIITDANVFAPVAAGSGPDLAESCQRDIHCAQLALPPSALGTEPYHVTLSAPDLVGGPRIDGLECGSLRDRPSTTAAGRKSPPGGESPGAAEPASPFAACSAPIGMAFAPLRTDSIRVTVSAGQLRQGLSVAPQHDAHTCATGPSSTPSSAPETPDLAVKCVSDVPPDFVGTGRHRAASDVRQAFPFPSPPLAGSSTPEHDSPAARRGSALLHSASPLRRGSEPMNPPRRCSSPRAPDRRLMEALVNSGFGVRMAAGLRRTSTRNGTNYACTEGGAATVAAAYEALGASASPRAGDVGVRLSPDRPEEERRQSCSKPILISPGCRLGQQQPLARPASASVSDFGYLPPGSPAAPAAPAVDRHLAEGSPLTHSGSFGVLPRLLSLASKAQHPWRLSRRMSAPRALGHGLRFGSAGGSGACAVASHAASVGARSSMPAAVGCGAWEGGDEEEVAAAVAAAERGVYSTGRRAGRVLTEASCRERTLAGSHSVTPHARPQSVARLYYSQGSDVSGAYSRGSSRLGAAAVASDMPPWPAVDDAEQGPIAAAARQAFPTHVSGTLPTRGPSLAPDFAPTAPLGRKRQLPTVLSVTDLAALNVESDADGGADAAAAGVAWRAVSDEHEADDCDCKVSDGDVSLMAVREPSADMERWHEITVSGLRHPDTGEQLVVVAQHDVSARVWAEQQLARVMEAEHALLEAIFPAHVIEHIAVVAAASNDFADDCTTGDRRPMVPSLAPRPSLRALATSAAMEAAAAGLAFAPAAAQGIQAAAVQQLNRYGIAAAPPALPITGDTFLHLATSHSALTVLFCDIQGFTSMCGVVKPATVMAFLNDLYTRLDAMLDAFGVYKVETIGDCYVAAGGLMKVDEETGAVTVRSHDVDPQHAHRTVQFAKALLRAASSVRLPTTGEPVRLRVGVHSGPAMSGVVGTRMPRFCLFGDTINTASRMESTGQPGAIHVSQATRDLAPGEDWRPTGGVQAKGKGLLETYLLRP